MSQAITIPALSDTMNNGRLVRWVKKIGDPVKKGESIADVETDKAVMEIEAFHDGYLAGPLAAEGSELPVGATIGYLVDSPGATTLAPSASASGSAIPGSDTPRPASPMEPSPPAAGSAAAAAERVRASPYARRLAQKLGVDVAHLACGHSPVQADAVLNAALRPVGADLAAGPPYRIERASGVRDAVAKNLARGLATPTFRITARLPLGPLRAVAKKVPISLTLLLARACALTVKTHPLFNALYTPEGLAMRDRVDVAIAVDTPQGLLAPVIRDVATRPLKELAGDWLALRDKALSRCLSAEDHQGATFYLSNLGMFSVVYSFDAVLPLGAAAILCVAAADGERSSCTLSCDHRVLAGADAARFLATLADYLAKPAQLTETEPRSCE